MINVYLKIVGNVQGVGMRYFIREIAFKHQLNGYVKNLADGSVECIVEGKENHVKDFITSLEKRSPGRITNLVKHESSNLEGYSSFEVRYY